MRGSVTSPLLPVRRAPEYWRDRLRRLDYLQSRLCRPSRLTLALGFAACLLTGLVGLAHSVGAAHDREVENVRASTSSVLHSGSRVVEINGKHSSTSTLSPSAAPSPTPTGGDTASSPLAGLDLTDSLANLSRPAPTPSPMYVYRRPICVAPAPDLAPLPERPEVFERCARRDFGDELVARWRRTGAEYCDPASRNHSSSLRGYAMQQARHTGLDLYCELRNGVRFLNGEVYLDECELRSAYKAPHKSRLSSRLAPESHVLWGNHLHFGSSDALHDVPALSSDNETHPASVWNGTTIFVYRDCAPPYNPFHCLNDFIATLLIRDGHNISRDSARVVFLDPFPEGNFIGLWRLLAARVVAKAEWESWGVFPVEHALIAFSSSFIWKDFWIPTPCPYVSPALFDFRALTLETLRRAPVSLMGLNLSSDASFDPWSEYPLPCDKVGRITVFVRVKAKSGGRYIRNNDAFIRDLTERFPDHDVMPFNPSTATFEQQLQLMHTTDLLIGMHGGAMTNLLYLKPGASVLELHPNTGNPARCYANMAAWAGIKYRLWQETTKMPSPTESIVNLEDVGALARKLLYNGTDSPTMSPSPTPTTTAPSSPPSSPNSAPATTFPVAHPSREAD